MYFDEKHGPHFHAEYAEHRAQISVLNGKLLGGNLPPRVLRMTSEWRVLHRAELLENWERARAKQKLNWIEAL